MRNNDLRLVWMTLLALGLLFSCGASAQSSNGDGEINDKKTEKFGHQRQRHGIRDDVIGQAVDTINDGRSSDRDGDQRDSSYAKPIRSRQPFFHERNDDVDAQSHTKTESRSGENRVRVLSAGYSRMRPDRLGFRRFDDPLITDDILNRFDDNNLENELNALAGGFEDRDRERYANEDHHDLEHDYAGLGFGDTSLDHQNRRVDGSGDIVEEDLGPPWTEWRPCNVTCGVGKQMRWRRCTDGSQGVCNRVTGREEEWRRCLGMDCDRKTIEQLGGGCKDEFLLTLLLGASCGVCLSLGITFICNCLGCYKQPLMECDLKDRCPDCKGCCDGCSGNCCGDCSDNCCGDCSDNCCSQPCCYGCTCCCPPSHQNPYFHAHQMHYGKHGTFYPHTYPFQGGGTVYYKRPPAPLPRESEKRKLDDSEPVYDEVDQFYQDSPGKSNYVKFKNDRKPNNYTSIEENNEVENDYLEILPEESIDDTYLEPRPKDERYVPDFEYLGEPPPRPR